MGGIEVEPDVEGDIDEGGIVLDDGPALKGDVEAEEGPAPFDAICNALKSSMPFGAIRALDTRLESDGCLALPWSDLSADGDVCLGDDFPFPFPFKLGLNRIPAGCPSGLCITNPEEGVVPSFCAAAEKYSMLSGIESGDGGMGGAASRMSRFDFMDRSELVREPEGRGP